jgi:alanine dehydrogenase
MRIGVPKETKVGETRVGLTPREVGALAHAGHDVFVQQGAGLGVNIDDVAFKQAGAEIVADAATLWARSELIAKVKELQAAELPHVRPGAIVAGFAQLARDRTMLHAICERGATLLAYECVLDAQGATPILAPMSRIAGAMSASVAAWCLQHGQGGAGLLVDESTRATIIGLGASALAAAEAFSRLRAVVTLVYRNETKAKQLAKRLPKTVRFIPMAQLTDALPTTDVLIGAMAEPGKLSPKLITREMLRSMPRARVFIDIGIDMGGIAQTSRQTTWNEPTYIEESIVHFCVPNMPAQVPATAAAQLAAAALPSLLAIANFGLDAAMHHDAGLSAGVQVRDGVIVDHRLLG